MGNLSFVSASAANGTDKQKKKETASRVLEGQSLRGRYAIVTGASSGIGRETARALHNAGAYVIMGMVAVF